MLIVIAWLVFLWLYSLRGLHLVVHMVGKNVYYYSFRLGIKDIRSVADDLNENNWISWYHTVQFNWKQIVWFVTDGLIGIQ